MIGRVAKVLFAATILYAFLIETRQWHSGNWVGVGAVIVIQTYTLFPWSRKEGYRQRFLARVARSNSVCLTFDDGPDSIRTPEVLEVLSRHNVRATFFMIGRNAERHPEIVKEVARLGHDIGSHSYAHKFAWTTDPVSTWRDLSRGSRVITNLAPSAKPELFRPPFGKLNLVSLFFMRGPKETIWWNVDPRDYGNTTAEEIAAVVNDELAPGAIILLHDGTGEKERPNVTARAVELIIEAARGKGLRFATIREALAAADAAK